MSATFLKLTTICDVSHVISFLSLIFSHKRGRPGDEAMWRERLMQVSIRKRLLSHVEVVSVRGEDLQKQHQYGACSSTHSCNTTDAIPVCGGKCFH